MFAMPSLSCCGLFISPSCGVKLEGVIYYLRSGNKKYQSYKNKLPLILEHESLANMSTVHKTIHFSKFHL